jgi:phage recombination protein Bet
MKTKVEAKALIRQQPSTEFTYEQRELIRRTIAQGCSDDELRLFLAQCRRTQLDPFARQIFAIRRWDSRERREIMQAQISIDGARLIAQRSGKYAGQTEPQWCGQDGEWRNVWLSDEPPAAARIGVIRSDFREPCYAVARYGAYVQVKKEGGPNAMWARMPDVMLLKCAESAALRRAFPAELSGLYTSDEMTPADHDADPRVAVNIAVPEPAKPQPDPDPPARPWRTFKEMIGEFAKLRERLKGGDDIYYEVLDECGVQHSNEFRDTRKAAEAYQRLLNRVLAFEAAQESAEESGMADTAALAEEIAPPDEEAML